MSAQSDSDFVFAPVGVEHRRNTLPLLTHAFGWGFLITGLIVGGGSARVSPFPIC
jgi:cytosine permease